MARSEPPPPMVSGPGAGLAAAPLPGADPLRNPGVLPTAAAPSPPEPGSPADQIRIRLQAVAGSGLERLSVALRPAQLGHVEIMMELGSDGRTQVTVSAERAETLTLLQRDSVALERILADAGMKTESGGLQFTLREDGRAAQQQGRPPGPATGQDGARAGGTEAAGEAEAMPSRGGSLRLDIRV